MGNVGPRSDIGPKSAHSEDIPLNDDIAVNVQKKRYPLLKICPMRCSGCTYCRIIATDNRLVLAFESVSILPLYDFVGVNDTNLNE